MADQRVCSIEGCGKPTDSRGWCAMHWSRWRKYGDPSVTKNTQHGVPLAWLRDHLSYQSDDCLIWPFSRDRKSGYGKIRFEGRDRVASGVMCELVEGPPPTSKHECAHSCHLGHTGCVHPKHVRWATRSENMMDRIAGGTALRGEKAAMAKLINEDVTAIRQAIGTKTDKEIAADFGVTPSNISQIRRRKSWAWLT